MGYRSIHRESEEVCRLQNQDARGVRTENCELRTEKIRGGDEEWRERGRRGGKGGGGARGECGGARERDPVSWVPSRSSGGEPFRGHDTDN